MKANGCPARGTRNSKGVLSFIAVGTLTVLGLGGCSASSNSSSTPPSSLAISVSSLPNGQVGTAYSATLAASGGTTPYTWSVASSSSLPSWLSLNASTGQLTGTPTQSGTVSFTIQVKDSSATPQTASMGLSFSVAAAPSPVSITTTSLPAGVTGTAYSATLTATGGTSPYTWSLISGPLPSGLVLGSSTGQITGTPSQVGTYPITLQVQDSTGATATSSGLSIAINSTAACGGPMTYCSRTDLSTVQVPNPVPSMGNLAGANTIVTDPDFSNRIVRVTDANTDPSSPDTTFVADCSGSGDENLWNTDSSLFIIQTVGCNSYPFAFDAATMQASRLYVSSFPSTNGIMTVGNGFWSHVNANSLYTYKGTQILKYDFTDRTNPPTPQTFYDFTSSANCLAAGFNETWQAIGGVDGADTAFGEAFSNAGGQGSGVYAAAYTVGSGCTLWNTQTGQITGDWGTTGAVNIPDRFTIHNTKVSKDGKWLIVDNQNCISSCQGNGVYFWQIGTTNVNVCLNSCTGHWTEGYTHWVNNDQTPMGQDEIRSFASPATYTGLIKNFPSGLAPQFDRHQSWNNATPSDNTPIFFTTLSSTTPFPAAWYDEVLGEASDGSGTVWRFCHTFNTYKSQRFSTNQAIGSGAQNAKFYLFSSDWMGTLGSEGGSSTCTIGSNCRGDVFIVELR